MDIVNKDLMYLFFLFQFSGYLPPLDAHEPKALQAMERENEVRRRLYYLI
jgi:hypothetical protein